MDQMQMIVERLESIDSKFDEKLDKILVQTTKTNGRVDKLEEWRKTQGKVIWWVLGIVGGGIVLLFEKLINHA